MGMRIARTLWAAVLLLHAGAAEAGERPVVVVPVGQEASYRAVARVSIAVRRVLASRGHVVTSAALVLSPRSPASSELAQAKAKLKEGIELYDGLDFKRARGVFSEAVELFRQALRQGYGRKDYVRALHYLAASALYDNDRKAAASHFVDAHAFRPSQGLDSAVFPPDVAKVNQEAIAAATERGSLNIVCNPPAEVLVNGKAAGAAPMLLRNRLPGSYLITCRRAGYESDSQWIAVEAGGKAEVRTELRPLAQKAAYAQAVSGAQQELVAGAPGPATQGLAQMLGAGALVLVAQQGPAITAVWFEGGAFTKRYQAQVAARGERTFAEQFVTAGAAVAAGVCTAASDCPAGQQCAGGRCVGAASGGTPFYKTWWFWTVVGVVVAGGATTAVVLTVGGKESWSAELRPGGVR